MIHAKSSALARVYLAGPDVFFPEPLKIAACKKKILAELGMEGMFPLDNNIDAAGEPPEAIALKIAQANEAMIRACDIVIANMEPWHGPSMDVGTAFEMGFGRALGKIVIGYTPERRRFSERVRLWASSQPSSEWNSGFQIEDFGGMSDNLMLVNALARTEAAVEVPASFEEAARLAGEIWVNRNNSKGESR